MIKEQRPNFGLHFMAFIVMVRYQNFKFKNVREWHLLFYSSHADQLQFTWMFSPAVDCSKWWLRVSSLRHSPMTAITSEVQVPHLPKSRQPPRDTKLQGWCLARTGVGTDWMSCLMEWKQEARSIQSLCRSFHPSNVEVSLQAFRKGVIICVCLKSWYTTNEYYSIEWGKTHYLQAGLGIF